MRFTVSQADLKPLLAQCAAVADSKSTMPILSTVLVKANGAISLAATDLYQSVQATVSGEIKDQGTIAVDARALKERVGVLAGDITFTLNGSALTLKAGSRKFSLQTVSGEDYPSLPDRDAASFVIDITGDALAGLLRRVSYAVSADETRLHLNSLLLESDGKVITAVATDGHRLSVAKWEHESEPFRMLLPLKGVTYLLKLCDEAEDGTVRLTRAGITLFVSTAHYDGSIRTHGDDIQFPPYSAVIPSNHTSTTTIDRLRLLDACRAVAVAASDRTGGVKLSFTKDALRLSTESPEGGDGGDEIACTHDGPEVEIGVNARYLEQALGAIEGDEVVIGASGELDPISIRAVGDESGSVSVLMPCRL